jgi:hypothetical protein
VSAFHNKGTNAPNGACGIEMPHGVPVDSTFEAIPALADGEIGSDDVSQPRCVFDDGTQNLSVDRVVLCEAPNA